MEKKILVVDDEPDIREILGIYIADLGYDVTTAEDGLAAFNTFKKEGFPIVVTDIKMPGMDGIDLLRAIKEEGPDTEVIMVTGHGDLELAIKSLKYEASDFITKPVNQDVLEVSLNRAIEKAAMRAEIRQHHEHLNRLVQEELRATRHKYHQLFEASPCFISVQDRHLKITESNRLFNELFGEAVGLSCYRAYKHREEPCPECPVTRTFEDGASHQVEAVVTSQDGRQFNVLITTAPIRDAEGKITHVMEVSTDISEIRELQDRLTSLGLLIGSVSHGIKGLLTGLDSGMYLLKTGFSKDDKDRLEEGWDIVKTMVGRIRKQVLNILYYAKDRELEWETVKAADFAGELAGVVEPKAEKHGIEFIRNFEDASGEIEIDPGVAHSALVNILENAVDACADDSSKEHHRVEFTVRSEGDGVVFDIRDNGVGMDRETREKMFTLFFSSKGSKGTGLGLFIAHQMIRRHGGDVTVDSEPGQGAHFRIRIPKQRSETEGEAVAG